MPSKRQIIECLSRSNLIEMASLFEISGLTGKSKNHIVDELMGKRSIAVPDILAQLGRDDLKSICEGLGLDSSGREKSILINRISGDKQQPVQSKKISTRNNSDKETPLEKKSDSAEKDAKAYVHEEATVSLRPDIGTQAQFRKKKPPKTYKYDSSLAPELAWDGQNPAREQGEAIIKKILEATTIEEAKEAAGKLKAMSKPFLNWAGKAERLSFDVPTLPLFVHERLSTKAIIETLKSHQKKNTKDSEQVSFLSEMFGDPQHSITDQVLKAYEYQDKWTNRMILGDSLVVMNSLLHYENMGGQVQMIFMDPPYGVKFGSNFQPFVRKREVKQGDDESMTREPEMVKAYRDTWELGLHSYLTYMRDRLLVARDLLKDTGSVFVQISDENVHHVREVMDEVFGAENFVSQISFKKTGTSTDDELSAVCDYLIHYAKSKDDLEFNQLYVFKVPGGPGGEKYTLLDSPDKKSVRRMTEEEISNPKIIPEGWMPFRKGPLNSQHFSPTRTVPFKYKGKIYNPGANRQWSVDPIKDLPELEKKNYLIEEGDTLAYKLYLKDNPLLPLNNLWPDTSFGTMVSEQLYVVQTAVKVIQRCILMATNPGDLVIDLTCGSGTTALASELWGRRWITCDISRVPLALARQRLLTATYPYFKLNDDQRGPSTGFIYTRKQNKKGEEVGGIVPIQSLKSIALGIQPTEKVLVDNPEIQNNIIRITGRFAFEATIPTPIDHEENGVEDSGLEMQERGSFIDRMLEVLRQSPVIQLPGNKKLTLKNIRLPAKTLSLSAEALVPSAEIAKTINLDELHNLHAEKTGERLALSDKPLAIVFGPESGAVSEKLVWEAAREANAKNYAHLLVIGFAIQPNARDLIEKAEEAIGIPATYIQMTPDLMMGDLLKNMRSSQIFSVCGLPDIKIKKAKDGAFQVELLGLDVFDPATMEHHVLDGADVPAWFLDTDYNGLCFHVCQAFFPRTGAWESLKKALKGGYEESVWDHLSGTISTSFSGGEHNTVAVKVIDDRGNELLVTKTLESSK